MKTFITITSFLLLLLQFTFAASLPAASGSNLIVHNSSTGALAGNGMSYKCETTAGSPHITNIRKSAEKLKRLVTTNCEVLNPGGSKCTKMSISGDAAVGICGKYLGVIGCAYTGMAADLIADKCAWFGLAGGTVYFDWVSGIRVIVYHS